MARAMVGNFQLYLPGMSKPIAAQSVSLPKLRENPPEKIDGYGFEVKIELDAESRRNLMVFWIIASALATARRILN